MSYVEKHLIAGESIQYETKLHWIVMLGHAAVAALLELFAIGILVGWAVLGVKTKGSHSSSIPAAVYLLSVACFVIGAALIFIGFLKRSATEMAVTNKRIIAKRGIANRRTIEILLSRVESVAVEEHPLGRILGYGTVIVRGTGGTPEVFQNIQHPLQFRTQVQTQIGSEPKRT